MRELVRSVNFGAVKFETAFTDGSPVIDICAFAKNHDVDLIITSTHGFTGFTHVLIGSIAEQVVRDAPCSVLVVPSHPHVRAANLGKIRLRQGGKTGRQAATTTIIERPGAREKLPLTADSTRAMNGIAWRRSPVGFAISAVAAIAFALVLSGSRHSFMPLALRPVREFNSGVQKLSRLRY